MTGFLRRRFRFLSGFRGRAAEGMRRAADRFPITIAALFGLALTGSLAEAELIGDPVAERTGPFFLVAALASLVAALASEPHLSRWGRPVELVATVSLGALAAYYGPVNYVLPVMVGGLLLLIPVAAARRDPESLPVVLGGLGFAAALGLLTLAIFGGGLSGTLASLRYLFGLPVPDRVFAQTWIWTGLLVAPLFALGRIPERGEINLGGRILLDRAALALFDFGAFPLLIIYALVLHAYAVKIALAAALPRGQIGWMVLAYMLTLFGTLIVTSGHPREGRPATSRFVMRYWPFFVPVPVGMLFVSLFERISAYGVTQERYLLGLAALVVVVAALLQLWQRVRGDHRLLLLLGGVALVLASFGPWSAQEVSIRSQLHRFERALTGFQKNQSREEVRQALAALEFLGWNDALDRTVPTPLIVPAGRRDWAVYARHFGLDPSVLRMARRHGSYERNGQLTEIAGYDSMLQSVSMSRDTPSQPIIRSEGSSSLPGIEVVLRDSNLILTIGNETGTFPIPFEDDDSTTLRTLAPDLELRDERRQVRLLVESWSWPEPESGEPLELRGLQATLLLRSQDWAALRR